MLRPRITPCLLIRNQGLVKTKQFTDDKYIGDPINAVKIFNEKSVDELIVLDIDATNLNQEPNFNLIRKLADECRMPLCYGGGIKNLDHAKRIIHMGVEKIAISSALFDNPDLISEIARDIGSQSIVGVLDVKKNFLGKYSIFTHNGIKKRPGNLNEWISKFQNLGIGELLINSIDRDGMQNGYDIELARQISNHLTVPFTFMGGASSLEDIGDLMKIMGVGCYAAGSLFVFKGKYRAVLINYPKFKDKLTIINNSLKIYND
jgi:imidazole glycerol-phosphate synthase subunit HisF